MKNDTMLYRSPGRETIWGVSVDTLVVDELEVQAKIAEGWNRTIPGAEQDAHDRAEATLSTHGQEQAGNAAELDGHGPMLRSVHKGRGVWEVQDAEGNVLEGGLTKDEARAKASV